MSRSQESAFIESVNVGQPEEIEYEGRKLLTGIFKKPMQGEVYLSKLNFAGDGQGDLKHHGGADKAVCVYSFDHYAYWINKLERVLAPGAFGENITIKGITEAELCIGDQWRLGDALVEVSQPRQPCFKLAMKHGVSDLALQVQKTGFTGWYLRVIQEGKVKQGDVMERHYRHPGGITVRCANDIMYSSSAHLISETKALLQVDSLSASWHNVLARRIVDYQHGYTLN